MVLAGFPRMASTSLKPPTSWVNLSDLTVMMLDKGIYPHIALLLIIIALFQVSDVLKFYPEAAYDVIRAARDVLRSIGGSSVKWGLLKDRSPGGVKPKSPSP